jgi:hypothetical protein
MTEKLEQTIKEEMVKMPKEMQEAINSSGWVSISDEIGKAFSLDDDGINNLQLEIGLVLLRYKKLNLLPPTLESSTSISKNDSLKLVAELDKRIFAPIEEKVKSLFKDKIKNEDMNWKQSINFIISGGDYSIFVDSENEQINPSYRK